MTDTKDLLPIGSVVLLQEGEKRLMIIGILQENGRLRKKRFDYLGVLYPEGHTGDQSFLFNREDIQEVCFRGYEDAEREAFLKELCTVLEV